MTILFENVQFLSAAASASRKRTPSARWADIINVLDYAVGDGSTDDTVAINLAIATGAANSGTIFFPKATYKVTSAILLPSGSNFDITAAPGAVLSGNFNGFILDNLSSPYNAVSGVAVIENLNIQNSFTGNVFTATANGTWSASGSPVTFALAAITSGIAVGGALWVLDSRLSTNSVFIGMITGISGLNVTLASAAVASGATSNLGVRVLQCYAAGASWSASAATITMAATRPTGIGTGVCYVYNYESFLADPKHDTPIGTVTWNGTTVTFVPGYGGAATASVGSADRLWFAPAAGAIRLSSVVGATVRNCTLSGFICLTTSQDKIVPNDPTVGAAEGFHVVAETNNFSNPSGFSGLMGQTGIYFQNNSISINSNHNSMWCAERFSGTACGGIGGRAEICYFGTIVGGDNTASNNSLSAGFIEGRSYESNLLTIYGKNGSAVITSVTISCNVLASTALAGVYLNSFDGSITNLRVLGSFGAANAIYLANPNNSRTSLSFTSTVAANFSTPSSSWRLPAQAWAATFNECITYDGVNLIAFALAYTVANLPGISTNPAAVEGDEFNVTDSPTATWGANVTTGGSSNHVKVRYNGSGWTVMGK